MGYDIIGYRRYTSNEEPLAHVQCPYAWQAEFRDVCGTEITNYSGRLTISNYKDFVDACNNILDMLNKRESNVNQYVGNLSNCPLDVLIRDFKNMRDGVESREIGYVSIS